MEVVILVLYLQGAEQAGVEHDRGGVLYFIPGGGDLDVGSTGDLQHGSGESVHFRCVHPGVRAAQDSDRQGWQGSGARQHLGGTVLEEFEVRRYLSFGLPNDG